MAASVQTEKYNSTYSKRIQLNPQELRWDIVL